MRTWPLWLKATLGVCLVIALASPAFAGEGEDEKNETSTRAVVVVKKQSDGDATQTVRVMRLKDGRWVAVGENEDIDIEIEAKATDGDAPKPRVFVHREEDVTLPPIVIRGPDGRVLRVPADGTGLVPYQEGVIYRGKYRNNQAASVGEKQADGRCGKVAVCFDEELA